MLQFLAFIVVFALFLAFPFVMVCLIATWFIFFLYNLGKEIVANDPEIQADKAAAARAEVLRLAEINKYRKPPIPMSMQIWYYFCACMGLLVILGLMELSGIYS